MPSIHTCIMFVTLTRFWLIKKNYLLHGENLGEQYPPDRHYAERRHESGSEEQYQHQPGSDRFWAGPVEADKPDRYVAQRTNGQCEQREEPLTEFVNQDHGQYATDNGQEHGERLKMYRYRYMYTCKLWAFTNDNVGHFNNIIIRLFRKRAKVNACFVLLISSHLEMLY